MVDAPTLPAQGRPTSSPLSLPATHCAITVHVGHPSPRYSTVSSSVCPQVVTVRRPPNGLDGPSPRKYTARGPDMNVEKPVLHMPDVYMPLLPYRDRSTRGAVPAVPRSVVTFDTGARHMGVTVGVTLGVEVREGVRVELPVPVGVVDALDVADDDAVPVRLAELDDDDDDVSVCELDGVPV